jgi:hypothetical protein
LSFPPPLCSLQLAFSSPSFLLPFLLPPNPSPGDLWPRPGRPLPQSQHRDREDDQQRPQDLQGCRQEQVEIHL